MADAPEKLRDEVDANRQQVALDKLREAIQAAHDANVPTEQIHKALVELKEKAPAASVSHRVAPPSPAKSKSAPRNGAVSTIPTLSDDETDKQLSLDDFTKLVGEREGYTDPEHLKQLFETFDADKSGTVSMEEYLLFSLHEALSQTEDKLVELFTSWDEDGSGTVSLKEFEQGVSVLGYGVSGKVCRSLFQKIDTDKSGTLKIGELKALLNVEKDSDKRKVMHAKSGTAEADVPKNFVAYRVNALPPSVALQADSDVSIEEQLGMLLSLHGQTVRRLFNDWDTDGNGGVDKKEFRRAITALGYSAPKSDIDGLFNKLNNNKDGLQDFIEFDELKKALNGYVRAANNPKRDSSAQTSMQKMKLAVDEHELLDKAAFSELLKTREGVTDDEVISKVFDMFDKDKSGTVDISEYLLYSLTNAMQETSSRAVDLFMAWDEDDSGCINFEEFSGAIKALGYDCPSNVSKRLFDMLDADKSGSLKYAELGAALRAAPGVEATKINVLAGRDKAKDLSKSNSVLEAKNVNPNFVVTRVRALPQVAQLEANSDHSIVEQLGLLLTVHSTTVINLFRDWDEDGNGGVNAKEFRKALAALGYNAPKRECDALFKELDLDGDGFLDFQELKAALKQHVRASHSSSKPLQPQPPPGPKPTTEAPRKTSE